MSQPIAFDSTTPRFGLPHLFPAQAQKEFIVNESQAFVDMLLHCAVDGIANAPPSAPEDGETWIVGPEPAGEWNGRAGHLAGWQAGTWLFVAPRDGMQAYDRSARRILFHDSGWQTAPVPDTPTGGNTIDAEARTAISNLIETLRTAGILPTA